IRDTSSGRVIRSSTAAAVAYSSGFRTWFPLLALSPDGRIAAALPESGRGQSFRFVSPLTILDTRTGKTLSVTPYTLRARAFGVPRSSLLFFSLGKLGSVDISADDRTIALRLLGLPLLLLDLRTGARRGFLERT